jgi:hypothetical protein
MKQFYASLLAAWLGFWSGIVVALLLFALLVSMSSCAASRPPLVQPVVPVDIATVQHLDSLILKNWLPSDLAGLPPYLVPAPAGSTPRQQRKWQKARAQNLARAGVLPAKVKNSSVATAPSATAINRPTSPVATGSAAVATDARKAGQRGGGGVATAPAASATGATLIQVGLPWWVWVLGGVGCCAVGWRLARGHW